VVVARVPPDDDWERAAAFVRDHWEESDGAFAAPTWADPLLRLHLGDVLGFAQAGPSDLAGFDRVWVLSIRGHDRRGVPERAPDVDERFGRVWVRRWDLGPSNVLHDFVETVGSAEVTLVRPEGETPCPFRRGAPRGGGLGQGPVWPADRFQCDSGRPWLFVGATVTEDLDLEPRHCIWTHPAGLEPIRVRFRDVPLGDRLVFHGGLYYEHERNLDRPPLYAAIRVDGEIVGRMIHRDGDGWKEMEVETRPLADVRAHPDRRGEVVVEVTAPAPHLRTFCWAASTRAGRREEP
jgi:hypothetical protein